jgi:hypothetical protein
VGTLKGDPRVAYQILWEGLVLALVSRARAGLSLK